MFLDGWRRWLGRDHRAARTPSRKGSRPRTCRPCVEPLEHRLLLTAYVVNSAGDEPDGNYLAPYNDHVADTGHSPLFDDDGHLIGYTPFTGECTLRAAIQQANA